MLLTILLTLVVYSAIATTVFLLTKQNETVIGYFGLGIVGCTLSVLCGWFKKLKKLIECRNKRSIFCCEKDGINRYCNLKDTNDIYHWIEGYKLVKRYAPKDEWKSLQPFDKEFIKRSKRNCNHCIHDNKECKGDSREKCLCKDFEAFECFQKK